MLERVWRKGNPLTLLVGVQTSTATMETLWRFLKKLEIELPYDPAIPLLGMHTEETRRERDTCTPVFITALFTIARTWKQPRCPWADEWIRKLWYIYTMEYYSAIKKNTFESVLMRWMKLEPIIQWGKPESERKKSESVVAQLCPTLCEPMDCSLPRFSLQGILQARVLEWVAIFQNHPTLSLSHRVQKTVLYICVSFAVSHTGLSLPSF